MFGLAGDIFARGTDFSGKKQNNAPSDILLTSQSVLVSAGVNAVVGTLSTTDADVGDTHTYSLVAGDGDTDNGSFNISGDNLRCNDTSVTGVGTYSVRIQTDDGTDTYAESFTIYITSGSKTNIKLMMMGFG